MNTLTIILITLVATIFGGVGSLYLKKATKRLKFDFHALKNVDFLIGVFLFGISTVIYMFALKSGDLNMVYPISSLSYVWISFLSIKYLGEKMNLIKWMGIILIIIGVFLIVR